ncbi:hypothetical protein [Tsukamurella soli]|uniref:Proteins of 100 residues with WXG n=1 Tax=Tsukamurella soli TaxID=644556 RepID=A0ABP8KGH9_9ACTN
MDPQTIDAEYSKLQGQAQNTSNLIQSLGNKLNAAAAAGDQNAREWQLDLRELALAVQSEEVQAQSLLTAIHSMVDTHVQQAQSGFQQPLQPQYQQPQYAQPQYTQPQYQQPQYAQPQYVQQPQGGMLRRFLGGGFGSAIASGAGFAIGDDIINDIF